MTTETDLSALARLEPVGNVLTRQYPKPSERPPNVATASQRSAERRRVLPPINSPEYQALFQESPEPGTCESCGGLGWLRQDVPVWNPAFGKLFTCKCRISDLGAKAVRAWTSPRKAERFKLESFDVALNPAMAGAFTAVVDFAAGRGTPWLVLAGGYGCGKTHLAFGAMRRLADAGHRVNYREMGRVLDDLKAGMRDAEPGEEHAPSYRQVMADVESVDVLILDEITAPRQTEWTHDRLDSILGHRYRKEMMTLLIANLDRDLFATLGPRIMSRVTDGLMCRVVICDGARDVRAGLVRP